ncbi:RNA polymerase subunit RPABC4/transcription elongation factor Spt4 [Kitasatospora sp. MAA4]|uniref:zinc ribbon domain-containing protein n=1 Tax=Kitasatospora sp. MAA4 TaxID=3035093 RepID=UPI0024763DCF|nr:zinc ribbon domain-containing protein [Kitasatospora sp. MAA4]MDH6135421.1 RNA polymerase subunit RPABC4/transcription elongation factor Spt4 [Kitasatospora sp. MAA4]
MSSEIYFTNNHRDLCEQYGTGAGFQFEFNCTRCQDTWRSPFERFTTGRAAGWVSKGVGAAWSMLGGNGGTITSAADGLAGATWGSSRDAAFERAIANAQGHFHRCARCTQHVCDKCWNGAQGLCLGCAPDTAAEAEVARRRGLNDAVSERAYSAGQRNAQSYDVETPRQLVCPQCSHETHGSAFCPGCGFRLTDPAKCTGCQAVVPAGAAFCPGCGTRQ